MERELQAWSLAKEWRGSTIQEIWQVNIVCIFQHMEQMSIFTQGEGVCGEHQRRHRIYQQTCHCRWWSFYVYVIFCWPYTFLFLSVFSSSLGCSEEEPPRYVYSKSYKRYQITQYTKNVQISQIQKKWRQSKRLSLVVLAKSSWGDTWQYFSFLKWPYSVKVWKALVG